MEHTPIINMSSAGHNVCFISWALVGMQPSIVSNRRITHLLIKSLSLLQERTNRGTYVNARGQKIPGVQITMRLRQGLDAMCEDHRKTATLSSSGLLITHDDNDNVFAVLEIQSNRLNRIAVLEDRKGYGSDIVQVWMDYTDTLAKCYIMDGVDACVPSVVTADPKVVPFFEKMGFIKLSTLAPPDMPPMRNVLDTPMIHPATSHGLTTTNAGYIRYMKDHLKTWSAYWIYLCLAHMEHLDVELE